MHGWLTHFSVNLEQYVCNNTPSLNHIPDNTYPIYKEPPDRTATTKASCIRLMLFACLHVCAFKRMLNMLS